MSMALLLTLLLPVLQDDPQVTYREGLFEEVDQGNLEKAAELYGKILKSGAPDALKAKALLRTGFCHEKKGRKKEAEQAWRDVIERYPDASETVKVARERLSRPDAGSSIKSGDDQIQVHIFNLGSGDDNTRIEARRMLLFLGEPTIPHLRRALLNRDRMVSEGAAGVLMEMELRDGIYEALRRFWFPKGDLSGGSLDLIPRLLEEQEADREKFLKDAAPLFKNSPYMYHFVSVFVKLPDPRFTRIVEDWLVETTEDITSVLEVWIHQRPAGDVLRLLQRLKARTPQETGRVLTVFHQYATAAKDPDRAVKAECLVALGAAPEGTDYFDNLEPLASHFSASELVRGPVSAWLSRRPAEDRRKLLENISNLGDSDDEPRASLSKECRKFLFEQMANADVPLETKELILASGFRPDTPEELEKYLAYCLHFWKEQGGKRNDKTDVLGGVVETLAFHLPPDSKDLPAVLDAAFDLGRGGPGGWGEHPEERRPIVMAAAFRSLTRNAATRPQVLGWLSGNASAEEKFSIGNLLEGFDPATVGYSAGQVYASGFRSLDAKAQERHWKELLGRYGAGPATVKSGMLQAMAGMNSAAVDSLMKGELTSPILAVRRTVIQHWASRRGLEAYQQLISALEDENEEHQTIVLHCLRMTPNLDAVPALIRRLNSPNLQIRDLARTMLTEFKQHFAAQAEWQRWYDETKKTLGK